ncbi:hypothetical protein [Paenibacillus ehimensis]|uniref:hypothetical protein n=1 Tax=Paenibacillus ehimensis TaxID=79264 RepID=UPI00046F697F|nr:hypothetical protein [Paenibacillus ehimensis]
MLADIERKVLRIIANYSAIRHRTPSIAELSTKTGRSREDLLNVLEELAKEGYVTWTPADPDRITLLQAWEREDRWSGWQVYGSR